MIAVDTNVLVYAHRAETPQNDPALNWLVSLAQGVSAWALPIFCLGEFLRVVTHPKIFDPPSTISQATEALSQLLASPTLRLLTPGEQFPRLLFKALEEADARGNLVFDAQIVAVCQEHGCSELLTEDRDFARFSGFKLLSVHDSVPEHRHI